MLQPVILAGGIGSRLWPLSREHYPKQFIPLVDEELSMLQLTLQRLHGLQALEPPIVVCNEQHRFLVAEQLRQAGVDDAVILLEPEPRNTAPAVALAALESLKMQAEVTLLVLAADHMMGSTSGFHQAIETGLARAAQGELVTFGVKPDRPESGYGYIRCQPSSGDFSRVERFVEKPDEAAAADYLASGNYYWNSGMFMFRAKTLLEELERHAPDIYEATKGISGTVHQDLDFYRVNAEAFKACPSNSLDYAVMEKTRKAVMVPLPGGWSDVGGWSAIWEVSEQDADGNATQGDVLLETVGNSYVRAESRLVAALGVRDLVIIETPDAVLVAHRDSVQDIKKLVAQLKQLQRTEVKDHTRVYRPWGAYEAIVAAPRFQAKRIIVNPGASLSLQLHHHRAEHWIVVTGCAQVTRGEEVFQLNEDESTYIPIGVKHRLENPGVIPLEIIEVQTGSYLGEDDIVRLEDQYGRTGDS